MDDEGLYSPYNGSERTADSALATPRGAGARGLAAVVVEPSHRIRSIPLRAYNCFRRGRPVREPPAAPRGERAGDRPSGADLLFARDVLLAGEPPEIRHRDALFVRTVILD
ncbi:hypothetical protein JCM17092_15210 [Haloplanus litoreus]